MSAAGARVQPTVERVATLSTTAGSSTSTVDVAVDGRTVVATGYGGGDGGAARVFTEASGGWADSTEDAVLVDSGGAAVSLAYLQSNAAVSGDTIVVSERTAYGPSFEDVFVEPPTGWHGTVTQTARLVGPGGASLGVPTISGRTVAAVGTDPRTRRDAVYVFTPGAGGWSGITRPCAMLIDARHEGFGSWSYGAAVASGRTIIVETRNADNKLEGRADLFVEPARGWSGAMRQTATLITPLAGSIGLSGRVAVVGEDVVTEPRSGWKGVIRPSARLAPTAAGPFFVQAATTVAVAGRVAVLATDSLGPEHECPCGGKLWIAARPSTGWHRSVTAPEVADLTSSSGLLSVATTGTDVFVADGSSIAVYAVRDTSGRTSRAVRTVQGIVPRAARSMR